MRVGHRGGQRARRGRVLTVLVMRMSSRCKVRLWLGVWLPLRHPLTPTRSPVTEERLSRPTPGDSRQACTSESLSQQLLQAECGRCRTYVFLPALCGATGLELGNLCSPRFLWRYRFGTRQSLLWRTIVLGDHLHSAAFIFSGLSYPIPVIQRMTQTKMIYLGTLDCFVHLTYVCIRNLPTTVHVEGLLRFSNGLFACLQMLDPQP